MEKIHISIVPMNADHLDEIAALERVCFSRPWSRNMLAEELENQCAAFLTALNAATGKVVGYAGLLVVPGIPPSGHRRQAFEGVLRFCGGPASGVPAAGGAAQQHRRHRPL